MNIIKIDVSLLQPAPYNPRKTLRPGMPGYRRLERSLREFDLVQPLVWNKTTGHLVSGHQRLEILKAKGADEVDVVVVELSLAKEKALNVALNNQLVGGDWEPAKLIDLVRELQIGSEIDVALTGFDADELRDLLLAPDDHVPETSDEPESGLVRVQMEVPEEIWERLRAELDPIIADFGLRLHVRLPAT
jgi:ParB-like chromosome segregation protein Spo0J